MKRDSYLRTSRLLGSSECGEGEGGKEGRSECILLGSSECGRGRSVYRGSGCVRMKVCMSE